MKRGRFLPAGLQGYIFGVVIVLLAAALTVITLSYQRHDSARCQGLLGAGFPASFICDASGESPLSSVGKIDWADLDSINPLGSLLDLLFYASLLWGGWFIVCQIIQMGHRTRP